MQIGSVTSFYNNSAVNLQNKKIEVAAKEVAQLPEEIANKQMDFNKKLIKANTLAKVMGLGNIVDTYA